MKRMLPEQIEAESFAIIAEELAQRGRRLNAQTTPVVTRVIHATADFDYADNLYFTPDALAAAQRAFASGAVMVCDTNMALAGINKPALQRLGGEALCLIADQEVAAQAAREGRTRAACAVDRAAARYSGADNAVFVVGNAPTALLRILELAREGKLRPALVIGVPVGFVNVVESKQWLEESGLPAIIARGRKGGSGVAAAICNALLYSVQGGR